MAQSIEDAGLLHRFGAGVSLLSEGWRFLRGHSNLWMLALVPVLFASVSVGTAGAIFWVQLDEIHSAFQGVFPHLEATTWWTWIWVGPGQVLFFLLRWIAVIVSFMVTLIAALLLSNLAAAPFLDALSERVEAIVLGKAVDEIEGLADLLSDTIRSFGAELQRLGFLGGIWVGLTLVGVALPGAHLLTSPLLVAITVLFLPLDYAGFALDRRGISFRERRVWLREHLPTMVGFGGVAFVSCLVPGLNLVVMPSLVTAGTLLVLRTRTEVAIERA